jgi:hypothetical protein
MKALPPVERIFPGYISFNEGTRPAWWKDDIAPEAWGKVHGVHEYEPGARARAIVITEMGLAVLGEGSEVTWVPYTEVARWEKLSKDPPISMSLNVRTKSGERVELPFPRVGEAFGFVQFLRGAMWEHDHARRLQ